MTYSNVLIVGAGPVGLTLAIDLAWRGIDVTVVETRARAAPPEPKCNHVAARTMEIFRRLGLAEKVRDAGLPADYPHDISYRTSFTGKELARIPIPCRRDRFTAKDGPDCNWPTPEPPHRINQIFLEPILFEHAAAQPRIRIINRSAAEDVVIEDTAASVGLRDLDTGAMRRIDCRFLIGCDGARSVVRKAIGAELTGDAIIQRVQSTFIRSLDLIDRQQHANAWGTGAINPRRSGMVYAIDGRERWLVHNYMKVGETDFDAVDRDGCIRTILGVGADFKYDIISKEDWFGRRLIANKFRERCAFIAGDAAHIWVPYAGYGMNAGIADAMNLSWLLSAYLNGWAPLAILDAYEAERWPITSQVSRFAMSHAEAENRRRGAVPVEIEEADRAASGRGKRSAGSPTRSTSSNMPAPDGTSAPTTIAPRSSPMMDRNIRATPWTATRPRRFPDAAHRIYGAKTPFALRRDGAGVHAFEVRCRGRCHDARDCGAQQGRAAQGSRPRTKGALL
jgi:2-polyprenyl-6-methoxyphenol hydroxylase-like FAD-dependent oxidoreductase